MTARPTEREERERPGAWRGSAGFGITPHGDDPRTSARSAVLVAITMIATTLAVSDPADARAGAADAAGAAGAAGAATPEPRRGAAAEDRVTRVYDLAAFWPGPSGTPQPVAPLGLFPVRSTPMMPWGLESAGGQFDPVSDAGDTGATLDADSVVDWLRSSMAAEAELSLSGRFLLVRGTAEAAGAIERRLARFEAVVTRRVPITVDWLVAEPGAALRTGVLDARALADLDAREGVVVAARDVGRATPGRRAVFGDVVEHAYLGDYEVEVAQEARIASPQRHVLVSGRQAALRVRPLASGDWLVSLVAESVRPELPIRRVDTRASGLGAVELPEAETSRVGTEARLPRGGGLVLSLGEPGRYVLVRVGDVTRSGERDTESDAGALDLIPIAALAQPRTMFEAPANGLLGRIHRTGTLYFDEGFADREVDDDPVVDEDALIGLVHDAAAAARGEDESDLAVEEIDGSWLLAIGSSEDVERARATVRSFEDLRARNVRVDVELVETTSARLADVRSRFGGATELGIDAGRDREVLVSLGGDVVGRFAGAALHGGSALVVSGTERASLGTYEVEIAQKSAIADPQVDHGFGGWVLRVEPVLVPDGRSTLVRLSGEYSELVHREATNFGADEIGDFELGRRRSLPIRLDVEVASDETRILPIGSDERGRAWVLVVRANLDPH